MYAMPVGVAVESKKDVEQPSADLRWLSVQELALAVQQLSTELATLKQESAASIQSLSEEVTQLKLNANNEPIVTLEGEDEDAVILSKPTSLYAWCFERLCQPLSIGKLLHAFSLLLLLTVAQLTLAFAFLDATWWVANAGKECSPLTRRRWRFTTFIRASISSMAARDSPSSTFSPPLSPASCS